LPENQLELRSAPSNGTPPDPPQAPLSVSRSLSGVRVLVVDDELDSRDFLTTLLGQHGAEVVATGSAKEAFAAFEARSPDVLVSDIAMANEDGYQLVRRIRALPAERGGDVPAIALTAYARLEDERRSLSEGFQAHLTKPVDATGIVRAVASLHERAPRNNNSATP
jgi:CheY-like chemotaxis protein